MEHKRRQLTQHPNQPNNKNLMYKPNQCRLQTRKDPLNCSRRLTTIYLGLMKRKESVDPIYRRLLGTIGEMGKCISRLNGVAAILHGNI